ncbi:hypothetical protein ALO94_201147 [Pseudomonas syringae pv. spinaceae]|uniref:Uncharacterized protein n=1 Tax=Pseudomonas syringae pv. spinaceae TaxID=264459 RepID=A0A0Q0AF58_PSESX|nr:hypothetical protein ALO94_201147 [Pseudomonas syringae pv. spinaceae]
MPNQLQCQIWHRSIAKLIEKLNRPEFWNSLVRLLKEYAPVDNWVVLMFGSEGVQAICYPDTADEEEIDGLLNRYVKGLYMLDPFYIANRENQQSGFFIFWILHQPTFWKLSTIICILRNLYQ